MPPLNCSFEKQAHVKRNAPGSSQRILRQINLLKPHLPSRGFLQRFIEIPLSSREAITAGPLGTKMPEFAFYRLTHLCHRSRPA